MTHQTIALRTLLKGSPTKVALGLTVALALSATQVTQAQEKIMIGEPSWVGAKIIANVLRAVITTKLGAEAAIVPGTNPIIFAAMDGGKGDIDVHPDVWLPNQKSLTDKYVDAAKTVGLSKAAYTGRAGFCVPTYMVKEHGIKSVYDLATPAAQKLFDTDGDGKGEIWIGASGWASTNIHQIKVRDYGIGDFLVPTKEDEAVFLAKLSNQIAKKRGVAFYCYTPHYVHRLHDVTMLEEPSFDDKKYKMVQPNEDADWLNKSKITVGDAPKMVHIAYSKSLEKRAPSVAKFLSNIKLETDLVSGWTREVTVEKKDPADVAKAWVAANGRTVDRWLGL
jgi:glycine betaine/proline transport system substrate-binding protein